MSEGITIVGCKTAVFESVKELGVGGVPEKCSVSEALWSTMHGAEIMEGPEVLATGGEVKARGKPGVVKGLGIGSHVADTVEMLWDDGKLVGFKAQVSKHSLEGSVHGMWTLVDAHFCTWLINTFFRIIL